ncbi:hypothetical protein GCM10027598_59640 [Amycolatopsis oliviviridis]|uniref:Uncharacterized protein n=1 Tax=Amycolatopsis oliviviridis TaxID=1471590 RepID=A0ABQ3LXV1_9PSEU|nr:hypothetical protein [Amycolatopsis oliviviridis]GHH28826.1 hypothetical protein GCM10017790_60290 [Amycolatopsis oliviviridis]
MAGRPASAVSLFTAVGTALVLLVGLMALIRHWVPGYFVLWCAVLAVAVGFHLWAARGSRDERK